MEDPELVRFARERITLYEEQVKQKRAAIDLIDRGDITFHEATADEPLHDVTDRRRQETLEQIELLEDVISLWKRRLPA